MLGNVRSTKALYRLLLSFAVSTSLVAAAFGQDAPGLVTLIKTADAPALEDVERLLGFPVQPSHLQTCDNVYLKGGDTTRPLRVDVLLSTDTVRYRSSFPVVRKLSIFRDTLQSFGIANRRVRAREPRLLLYKLGGPFAGYMLADPETFYASVAEYQEDILPIFHPDYAIDTLLEREYDFALQVVNPSDNPESDIEQRRVAFRNLRDRWAGRGGLPADSAGGRLLQGYKQDELERFYAEAERVVVGWKSSRDGSGEHTGGRLDLEMAALDGTSLQRGIEKLTSLRSRFANLPQNPNSILHARLLLPLGDMRQTSVLRITELLRSRAAESLHGNESRTEEQKAATTEAFSLLFEMLDQTTKTGVLDAFATVHANDSGTVTLLAGIRAPNGNNARKILTLLQQAKEGRGVQFDLHEERDVKIHMMQLAETDLPGWRAFFGDASAVYVGTGEDTVWIAIGEHALDELKTCIRDCAETMKATVDATFVDISVEMQPWIDMFFKDEDGDDQSAGRLTLLLQQSQGTVTGEMLLPPGLLRFLQD